MQRILWRKQHKKGGSIMWHMDTVLLETIQHIKWKDCMWLLLSYRIMQIPFLPKSGKRPIWREATWPCSQIASFGSVKALSSTGHWRFQHCWQGQSFSGMCHGSQALCKIHYSHLSHNFPNCPFAIPFYRWGCLDPQRLSDLPQLCNEAMAESPDSPTLISENTDNLGPQKLSCDM